MKVSKTLCALLFAFAAAENAMIDMAVAGLTKYMGLTTER